MSDTEQSPSWLLPLIVVILIASVILLFIASRPSPSEISATTGEGDFRQGPLFRLPQISSPTDPVDPCSLVEDDQVEDIVGRDLSEPQSIDLDNPIGERLCVFTEPGNPDERLVVLDIVFQQGMASVMTQNNYDVIELYRGRKVQDRGIEDVDGIEDEAFWGGAESEIWSGLHVRSSDVYMRVLVYGLEDEQAIDAAREILIMALSNLFE